MFVGSDGTDYTHLGNTAAMATSIGASASAGQALEMSKSGIPKAPFIEDVEAHLGGADEDAEPHLRKLQETMSKYKMMEVDRRQRQRALEDKIPDIQKTLVMVEHLKEKKVCVCVNGSLVAAYEALLSYKLSPCSCCRLPTRP